MPVFALLALVAYSVSLALIVPGLLQKNGGWRRMAIISAVIALVCHAIALEARILPDGDSGQNLSLLNVGSLVSLMICTVMTIVASRNRGWLLLPIVYAFALINLALATFMPNEYITHLEATPGMLVHIGLSLFSYATLIIAALYALGESETALHCYDARGERGVRYVLPQKLHADSGKVELFFRVDNVYRSCRIVAESGGRTLYSGRRLVLAPGEMEKIVVDTTGLDAPVTVRLEL